MQTALDFLRIPKALNFKQNKLSKDNANEKAL